MIKNCLCQQREGGWGVQERRGEVKAKMPFVVMSFVVWCCHHINCILNCKLLLSILVASIRHHPKVFYIMLLILNVFYVSSSVLNSHCVQYATSWNVSFKVRYFSVLSVETTFIWNTSTLPTFSLSRVNSAVSLPLATARPGPLGRLTWPNMDVFFRLTSACRNAVVLNPRLLAASGKEAVKAALSADDC